jgi:hypothetical protein
VPEVTSHLKLKTPETSKKEPQVQMQLMVLGCFTYVVLILLIARNFIRKSSSFAGWLASLGI